MTLRPLAPAVTAGIAQPSIAYIWDDADVQPYPDIPSTRIDNRLAGVSGRASIALTLAIGEWICQRFSRLSADLRPMQFLEAGWAEEMQPGRCRLH